MTMLDARPLSVLRSFRGLRVVVVGEAILDGYLSGAAERLSREAPVPIVALRERVDAPGGAANTAVNLAALGAEVDLLTVVGRDAEGERLTAGLEAAGVSTSHVVRHPDRTTLAKQRVSAAGQMLLRFDSGSTDPLDAATEDALIDRLNALAPAADAIVVSDYDYGIVTDRILAVLAELQRQDPHVLVVDARDLRRYRRVGATAAKPNYSEACSLLGLREDQDARRRAHQIGTSGARLLELTGARVCAVTLDTDGAFVFEAGQEPYRTYATAHPNSRCAGAGDTFVAALTLALAGGGSGPVAGEIASAAAAVVVVKDGTSTCTSTELEAELSAAAGKRIEQADELALRLSVHRRQGHRIVFTNGCFDILHRGHVAYLQRAKALGDVLVVAVNSDASVRRLKGPSRPINDVDDRLEVLAALSCVDHVVAFDDDTPEALIRDVRPDVFVKGGDYTRERLPEAPLVESLGGAVRILPYLDDRSTSNVIARVRAAEAARAS
ncbi:MAG: D-glycero-beta-D-manno-heptose 1-phosphate adenylyltransferase [Chloroflexota bacterium]